MNGIESLLLIIIGFLSIAFSVYLSTDDVSEGIDKWAFLFTAIYGLLTFVAGNIMLFTWIYNLYSQY